MHTCFGVNVSYIGVNVSYIALKKNYAELLIKNSLHCMFNIRTIHKVNACMLDMHDYRFNISDLICPNTVYLFCMYSVTCTWVHAWYSA